MEDFDKTKLEGDYNTIRINKKIAEERRKIWQQNHKGLQISVGNYVKLAIEDDNGVEHLWFMVTEIEPLTGMCDNTPILIESVRYNDSIQFQFEDIEDYYGSIRDYHINTLIEEKKKLIRKNEAKIKYNDQTHYLAFIKEPSKFDFNNEESWKKLFEPENLMWVSEDGLCITDKNNFPNVSENKALNEISTLYSNCLIWIFEICGEIAYRNVAQYLHFSEKEINEDLKEFYKIKKEERKNESK